MLTREIQGNTIMYHSGPETVLIMEETPVEGGVHIRFEGQLRSEVAHDLQDELIAFITSRMPVTVDMEQVTYIANAVQEVLVSVQQCVESMGVGGLTLEKLPGHILEEFENTGIIDCLDVVF